MFRPRAEHGQRGEGHPQTDCTLQVSCSYLIVMILQRLCLLSKCLNKCNFAMYSTTTNHYLHTPTYRSHLPTHPSSPVNSSPTYHIEIWTSVSSALCTATNNPQNGEISHAGMKSASLVLTRTHPSQRPTRAFVQKCSRQLSVYSKAEWWKWPGLLSPSLPPALPTTVGHKTILSL